jgi:hypothetical protein
MAVAVDRCVQLDPKIGQGEDGRSQRPPVPGIEQGIREEKQADSNTTTNAMTYFVQRGVNRPSGKIKKKAIKLVVLKNCAIVLGSRQASWGAENCLANGQRAVPINTSMQATMKAMRSSERLLMIKAAITRWINM